MLDYCEPVVTSEWHECEPSLLEAERDDRRTRIKEQRLLEEVLVASKMSVRPVDTQRPLAERFQEQADKWERETAFLSATPMIVMHESYQAIMSMGPDVVPILLRDMQKTRRHWFWALRHLEPDADPIRSKDHGNVDKMIEAWVEWGRMKGKI
jgi:hypothetical protein